MPLYRWLVVIRFVLILLRMHTHHSAEKAVFMFLLPAKKPNKIKTNQTPTNHLYTAI